MLKNYSSTTEFYLLGFPGSKELRDILFAPFFSFYLVTMVEPISPSVTAAMTARGASAPQLQMWVKDLEKSLFYKSHGLGTNPHQLRPRGAHSQEKAPSPPPRHVDQPCCGTNARCYSNKGMEGWVPRWMKQTLKSLRLNKMKGWDETEVLRCSQEGQHPDKTTESHEKGAPPIIQAGMGFEHGWVRAKLTYPSHLSMSWNSVVHRKQL